jgi:myo-inositol 2-dehydrogenase/D-chiro-inositol 1-dehydrogenase
MDILRFMMGDVERVYAEGANLFNPQWSPQLDTAVVSLRFRSGALASVACGQAYEWEFTGETTCLATDKALVEISGSFDSPERLRYVLRSNAGTPVEIDQGQVNLFDLELAHFAECVRTGAEPLVTGESARGAIAVCLAVKESARTGRPVAIR